MAGKKYNEKGGGSDTICLPSNPTWSNYTDGLNGDKARVYGTEFNSEDGIFPKAASLFLFRRNRKTEKHWPAYCVPFANKNKGFL